MLILPRERVMIMAKPELGQQGRRPKGASIRERRIGTEARRSGDAVYIAPPTPLSPLEQMRKETFDSIRKMPRFRRAIKPHLDILNDFWATRINILNGADKITTMDAFFQRYPVLEVENPVSTALAPATTFIRNRIEALAKTRK